MSGLITCGKCGKLVGVLEHTQVSFLEWRGSLDTLDMISSAKYYGAECNEVTGIGQHFNPIECFEPVFFFSLTRKTVHYPETGTQSSHYTWDGLENKWMVKLFQFLNRKDVFNEHTGSWMFYK